MSRTSELQFDVQRLKNNVSNLNDVLTDPKVRPPFGGDAYVGSELSRLEKKLDEKISKDSLPTDYISSGRYVECHECGVLVARSKATPVAVLKKDVPDEPTPWFLSSESFATTHTNALVSYGYDAPANDESKTIHFCRHCKPVAKPRKKAVATKKKK